ncbi:MAG: hypothetical protein HC940_03715 [Acaryochloris sp. SU_5_25]|nr:hypothetical protein [Acaryochloris sp. SU_5_25]
MKALKLFLIGVSGLGLLFLGACSSGSQTASNAPSSAPAEATAQSPKSSSEASGSSKNSSEASKGGQVVESGPYHLEFVPEKADGGTHLDFYLQRGDTHAALSDAKVTAQVQLPDGTQQSLDLKYDSEGKHYTVLFTGSATGEHKVAILSDIDGEKVNGRFSFKQ